MDQQQRIDSLEQALRDAAGQRDAARRQAALQAQQTQAIQAQADELAGRVAELEAGGRLQRLLGRRRPAPRRGGGAGLAGSNGAGLRRPPRPVTFPTVKVASLVSDPILATVLAETDTTPIGDDRVALDAADLVVVEAAALATITPDIRARFDAWVGSTDRAPLMMVDGDGSILMRSPDVAARRSWVEAGAADGWPIPPTFDVIAFNPRREFDPAGFVKATGLEVPAGDGAVFAQPLDANEPWMLAAAATGFPFPDADGTDDSLRRAVAARRTAYRASAPWVVAASVLDRAGVGHEDPLPRVAGIVVASGQEKLKEAVFDFAAQHYERKELVIGCHGFPSHAITELTSRVEDLVRLKVIEFDRATPFGRCLNRAIEATSAPIVAIIDPDDFHGPGYVEDAVQANRYAAAPLITKGAAFTYLEARGETVLARPTLNERFYDARRQVVGLVFERSLWERVPFPHVSDDAWAGFVHGAQVQGIRPYATAPFEFVYYRGVGGHAWGSAGATFLDGSVPAWQGYRPDLATVTV